MNGRRLIQGLKKGDHNSYEALFDLYYAKFVNFADAILKDTAVAKDLVQEAFIRIWINRSKLDENQSLENYIYVIVKRLIINYIRDSKPSVNLDAEKAHALSGPAVYYCESRKETSYYRGQSCEVTVISH